MGMIRSIVLMSGCFLAALFACMAVALASGCAGNAKPSDPGEAPFVPEGLSVPSGFGILTISRIPRARELASLPGGDLLIGTTSRDVYIVPNAERLAPGRPQVFATMPDGIAAGVAFSARRCEIFIATEHAVYATPYTGERRVVGDLRPIARVRTGPIAPNSDGDVHSTTSVAFADATDTLYVSVGSSCNACQEADATRAAIFAMTPTGGSVTKRATRIRNAIALTADPATGALWAGDAGQDNLPSGHPFEFLDDVSSHSGLADYGWPECEEHHLAYVAGANCAKTVEPLIELPAYSTIIGAVFYPREHAGAFAFPEAYRGALFATAHGSWHAGGNRGYAAEPQVVTIAIRDGRPATPVDWHDSQAQWRPFIRGFQPGPRERIGRPTGIAVGAQGSLFVGDDQSGAIYRIRPKSGR
jgi:glucose/arabinose dehydrogenase